MKRRETQAERDERIVREWGWRWIGRGDRVTCDTGMSKESIQACEAAGRILNRIARKRRGK